MIAEVLSGRDPSLLVRVTVRDQSTISGHEEGKSVAAHADAVYHPPEFLEVDLAHQPAVAGVSGQRNRDRGRGQKVVVDGNRSEVWLGTPVIGGHA